MDASESILGLASWPNDIWQTNYWLVDGLLYLLSQRYPYYNMKHTLFLEVTPPNTNTHTKINLQAADSEMKSEKMTKSASTCANMLTIQLFEVESIA